MFKFIIGGRRRAGMTTADYEAYTKRVHGGKVLAQPEPSILRYVQTHIVDAAYGTMADGWTSAPDFDSMTELWFEDAAAMQRELASDHYRNVVKLDEAGFADPGRIVVLAVTEEEQPIKQRLNGDLKVMRFLRRKPEVSAEEFLSAWRNETARLADLPGLSDKTCRVVRNVALAQARENIAGDFIHGTPVNVYDGVENFWFDGPEDMSGLNAYRDAIESSPLNKFLDRSAEMLLMGRESLIIPLG